MRNFYIGANNQLHEILADPVDTLPGVPFFVSDMKTYKLFYSNQQLFDKVPTKLTWLQFWLAIVIYLVERNLKYT